MAVVAAVGTWKLAALRARIRREHGTLYYVRLLESGMRDERLEDMQVIQRQHLDIRASTAWVDAEWQTISGVRAIDVAAEVRQLARDLQQTMNDDDVSTGFNIAPNLLWPMGMALGAHLYPFPGTHLLEPAQGGRPEVRWDLWSKVERRPANGVELIPPEADAQVQPHQAGGSIGSGRADGPGAVVAAIELTRALYTLPNEWKGIPQFRIVPKGRVADPRVETVVLAAGKDGTELGTGKIPAHAWTSPGLSMPADREYRVRAQYISPGQAAAAIVAHLRKIIHEHASDYVILVCAVPKTMSLSFGWLLGRPSGGGSACGNDKCTQEACRVPWSRLVTVQLHGDGPPGVTRVHPRQPSLLEMARASRLIP
ncbi:hypothetical protein [Propionicicella superfundia]|uniref:hypothetical protein n=1 Tax=Propionicicella superfundia TaxID=348582 RepID=UPI001B7FAC48|nr:hypothetical protein [Propionicicella superfundia]